VKENLACLEKILQSNREHGLLFFRITSDLVPFASHPICTFPWQAHFAGEFRRIGEYIRQHGFRISMHPDQFVLLNAPDKGVLQRSIADLVYQTQVLDLMGLDPTAKVQIHAGGAYGNKPLSMDRVADPYELLDPVIKTGSRSRTMSGCIRSATASPFMSGPARHRGFVSSCTPEQWGAVR
jgi:UV DNA damage endonuclease